MSLIHQEYVQKMKTICLMNWRNDRKKLKKVRRKKLRSKKISQRKTRKHNGIRSLKHLLKLKTLMNLYSQHVHNILQRIHKSTSLMVDFVTETLWNDMVSATLSTNTIIFKSNFNLKPKIPTFLNADFSFLSCSLMLFQLKRWQSKNSRFSIKDSTQKFWSLSKFWTAQ